MLLESCSGGIGFYQDICRLRLEMYQDLQVLLPSELRKQFGGLITQTLQYLNDDQHCEHMEDHLFLLCNYLRNDRAIVPPELYNAIGTLRDATGMTVPWLRTKPQAMVKRLGGCVVGCRILNWMMSFSCLTK